MAGAHPRICPLPGPGVALEPSDGQARRPRAPKRALAVWSGLLAVVLVSGCAPLRYLARTPVPVPVLEPVPEPEPYVPAPGDCPAFRWNRTTGDWEHVPWGGPGASTQTVPVGFPHPAVEPDGSSACLHLVLPPGAWIEAREARDRLPLVRDQVQILGDYIVADRALDAAEDRAMLALVKAARRRQLEAFAVGGLAGAVAATAAAVVIVVVASD